MFFILHRIGQISQCEVSSNSLMIFADCAVFIKNFFFLFFGMPKFFIFRAVKEHKLKLMLFDYPYCLNSRR